MFLLANIMAFFHARKFTHFDPETTQRIDPSKVPFIQKLKIMFTGVSLPRPVNRLKPVKPYKTIILQSNVKINCWEMTVVHSKGTVVLCHGYGGEKSDMLERAYVFMDMGYNVLLPDFMGTAASEGNQCTIGYKEADNVRACFDYLQQKGEKNICLIGSSMGAVAIMRACSIYKLPAKALILECPFGTMRQTVKNRFEMTGVPAFPLSDLLVLWGGVQNGFNAFNHNPEDYAKQITIPVLLLFGGKDDRVKAFEIQNIYNNLASKKRLITYPLAGHESYLNKYQRQWTMDVDTFLKTCN
jgi:alpha-beta hydrolase superfamily lysophospholipase